MSQYAIYDGLRIYPPATQGRRWRPPQVATSSEAGSAKSGKSTPRGGTAHSTQRPAGSHKT